MVLTRHYEELRAQALGEAMTFGAGRGLTIFLRRGLVAWLVLCQELLASGDEQRSRTPPAVPVARMPLPAGVQADLVRTLASMVSATQSAIQKGGA